MTELWNYRHDIQVAGTELIGYDVEATDGHIGTIDESSIDADNGYLVVDTGFWIFGKKRVVPANAVRQINHPDRKVFLDIDKAKVEGAPDHHDHWNEPEAREPFAMYYGPLS
jgi:hypothetical protein